MSSSTVHCHVLGGQVTVVSGMDGEVTNVICPQFFRPNRSCVLKKAGKGFVTSVLSVLLDKVTGSREYYCEFCRPIEGPADMFRPDSKKRSI